ncbi:MAG: 2-oxoglutarate dehydrogenase E1 subunit family protein, partial [Chloroflexota bacterium]
MNNPWEPVIVTHDCDDPSVADWSYGNFGAGETQSETDREMGNSTAFHGPNAGYVVELYEQYLDDPESVSPEVRRFFADWTPPSTDIAAPTAAAGVDASRIIAVASYVNAIRRHGHRAAKLSPIGSGPKELPEELRPETYGLSEEDLASLPGDAVPIWDGKAHSTALDAIEHLRR